MPFEPIVYHDDVSTPGRDNWEALLPTFAEDVTFQEGKGANGPGMKASVGEKKVKVREASPMAFKEGSGAILA